MAKDVNSVAAPLAALNTLEGPLFQSRGRISV